MLRTRWEARVHALAIVNALAQALGSGENDSAVRPARHVSPAQFMNAMGAKWR